MPLSEPLNRLVSWLASLSERRQEPESPPPTPVQVHLHGEMTEAKVRQIVRDEVRRATLMQRP